MNTKAYHEGRDAASAGRFRTRNPYTKGTAEYNQWMRGYDDQTEEDEQEEQWDR